MSNDAQFDAAVDRLRQIWIRVQSGEFAYMSSIPDLDRTEILAKFQPIFSPKHLPNLTESEFRSFLLFRNNRHWTGLHRLGPRIVADMENLRDSLAILLDEEQSIAARYEIAIGRVSGMGRAIATAILQVVYPDKYGVWNSTAEGGLKALDMWPRFESAKSEGKRYAKINSLLNEFATAVSIDLWTLDALWWYLLLEQGTPEPTDEESSGEPPTVITQTLGDLRFGLERHLHEFLRDNWDHTELGKDWTLHREQGNSDAGYEYPTGVGRIDLLAHHRTEPKWLIVELKRNQTGDQTLGQVMRYMGWVKRNLARPDEAVNGLIIAHTADPALSYAVIMSEIVELMLYQVHFELQAAPDPAGWISR